MLARALVIVHLVAISTAFAANPATQPSLEELRKRERAAIDRLTEITTQIQRMTEPDEPPTSNPATVMKQKLERAVMLNALKQRYQFRKDELNRDLREKAVRLAIDGLGTPGRLSAKEVELQDLLKTMFELSREASETKANLVRAEVQAKEGKDIPVVTEAIERDVEVRALRQRLAELRIAPSPDAKEIERLTKLLDDKSAAVRAKATAETIEKLRAQADAADGRLRTLQERVDATKKDLGDLNNAMAQYLALKDDEQTTRELLKQVNQQLEQISMVQGDPEADAKEWQERLEARKQQAQVDIAQLRGAIASAEDEQAAVQFGRGRVSLYLSRDALGKAEPSLRDVTYAGVAEIDGRKFVRFKNETGEWLIESATIAGVHRGAGKR
jgi:predicted  nucleic acid-binding Zn-ribbon protein